VIVRRQVPFRGPIDEADFEAIDAVLTAYLDHLRRAAPAARLRHPWSRQELTLRRAFERHVTRVGQVQELGRRIGRDAARDGRRLAPSATLLFSIDARAVNETETDRERQRSVA
jgi:hypothetical protein